MNSTALAELIHGRRTIHKFRAEVPPRKVIMQAIELARWAPNHRLTEPWRFYLLGPETAKAIARLNAELVTQDRGPEAGRGKLARWRAVPGWVVVTCLNSDDPVQAREDYAACCCAVQNFQLFLWANRVGVKWTTGKVTHHPDFYDLIRVDPTEETLVGMLWYGYPLEVPRINRKPVAEFAKELP